MIRCDQCKDMVNMVSQSGNRCGKCEREYEEGLK